MINPGKDDPDRRAAPAGRNRRNLDSGHVNKNQEIAVRGRANLRELLELGIRARSEGQRPAALAYFETAIAANPRHVRARLEAAREHRHMARATEAESLLRSIVADNPDQIDTIIELGELLHEQSQLAEAGRLLRRAIELEPKNVKALLGMARIARAAKDDERSARFLDRAAAANPSHPGTQIAVAIEFRDQGQFAPARKCLDTVLRNNPNHVGAWMHIGRLERMRGDREAALSAFGKVLEFNPEFVQALIERAIEERAVGRPFVSEQTLGHALSIDPNNLAALLQSAEHAFLAQDDEKALQLYQRAIATHPANVKAYINASRVAANLGRDTEAFQYLDRANDVARGDPAITARRIFLLRLAGEWHKALAFLGPLIEDCYRHFQLWHQYVTLQLATGNFAAVDESLGRAPAKTLLDSARVHEVRGNLAEARWDFAGAMLHYRQAIELNSSDPTFHIELARVCLLTLEVEAARQCLSRAIELSASARVLRGESLNISQNYLGQILNEFALDPALARQIHDALRLPAGERMPALRAIAGVNPDSTVIAISLLTELRKAGAFSRPMNTGAPGDSMRIPRRIIQYWDASTPPRPIVEMMQTWRKMHPDWDHQRFDDKLAREFLRTRLPVSVLHAYIRASHPAQKADVFRLAYLYCEGGFYADADDRCLADLKTIVPGDVDLVVYQEGYGTIGNNFLGASAGSPVLKHALDRAVESINRGDKDVYWLSTGPGLISRTFAHFLSEPGPAADLLRRAAILDGSELAHAVAVHCHLSYKSTDKHWINSSFAATKPPAAAKVVATAAREVVLANG